MSPATVTPARLRTPSRVCRGCFSKCPKHPLLQLLRRYAQTHAPFTEEAFAVRHGLTRVLVRAGIRQIGGAEVSWWSGSFSPHRNTRLNTATLRCCGALSGVPWRALRGEVEAVDRTTLARFPPPAWHGADVPRKGMARLEEALVQLEGMPLSYRELERTILPARVKDFQPRMLDELGAMGFMVWVGRGALGRRDGRVAMYRRSEIHKLVDPPELTFGEDGLVLDTSDATAPTYSDLERCLLEVMAERGACFFTDLERACFDRFADQRHTQQEVRESLWDLVWKGLVNQRYLSSVARLRPSVPPSAAVAAVSTAPRRDAGRWCAPFQGLPTVSPNAHTRWPSHCSSATEW